MGIFKRPKLLVMVGAILLVLILLGISLVFLLQPKTVGLFGLDPESEETLRIEKLLQEKGYTVLYGQTLEDLQNSTCKTWIVETTSDAFAQEVVDIIGDKAIFIGSNPSLSQSVRYVGLDMVQAGIFFGDLLSRMPSQADTNEDGSVSCLLLTLPEEHKAGQDWLGSLTQTMADLPIPCEILDTCHCSNTADAAMEATLSSLSTYGRDIEVILAASEALANGAAKAIKDGGWQVSEDLYLLAIGSTQDSLTALTEKQCSGLVYADWAKFDSLLLEAVADTIKGSAPKSYLLPFTIYSNTSTLK